MRYLLAARKTLALGLALWLMFELVGAAKYAAETDRAYKAAKIQLWQQGVHCYDS